MDEKLKEFRSYCFESHDSINQKYDGMSYSYHLTNVDKIVCKFSSLIKGGKHGVFITRCGAFGHDLIEDVHFLTYNDIVKQWGEEIADIIWAKTESAGRNRAERHDEASFNRIREHKNGAFLALCDTIANVEHGLYSGSKMVDRYRSEFDHMKSELYTEDLDKMWKYYYNLIF